MSWPVPASKETNNFRNATTTLLRYRSLLTSHPVITTALVFITLLGSYVLYGSPLGVFHHTSPETLRNHTQDAISLPCEGCEQLDSQSLAALSMQLAAMIKPIVPLTTFDTKELPQLQGKSLCIADVDTRDYAGDGQILSTNFEWAAADTLSAGMLNHYTFAAIHNYSYHMIRSQEWPGRERDSVWSRLPRMLELLEQCSTLLVLDSDVVFQHLQIPFEHLLLRWGVNKDTAIALPWDTEGFIPQGRLHAHQSANNDDKGKLNMNAGVVVVQNTPRAREILKAWIACPDEIPGCQKYRHSWPAEQGAFNNFIRYLYTEEDIVGIPCNDANGYPEQPSDCNGEYLRHFTTTKLRVKENVADVLLSALAKVFARQKHSFEESED